MLTIYGLKDLIQANWAKMGALKKYSLMKTIINILCEIVSNFVGLDDITINLSVKVTY